MKSYIRRVHYSCDFFFYFYLSIAATNKKYAVPYEIFIGLLCCITSINRKKKIIDLMQRYVINRFI